MSDRLRHHPDPDRLREGGRGPTRRNLLIGGSTMVGVAAAVYALRQFGISLTDNEPLTPMDAFYPEMAGHVKETFSFLTNRSRNRVNIFNLSGAKVDQGAAETVFNFWERTGYVGMKISDPNNMLEGKLTPTNVGVEYFVFIAGPDAPNPSWNPTKQSALTIIGENNHKRVNLSLIRLMPLREDEIQFYDSSWIKANTEFLTEACQTSIVVESTSTFNAYAAQERICNSIADALAAHLSGKSYTQYAKQQDRIKYNLPNGLSLNASPLTEELFDKLKALPAVIIGD